MKKEDQLTIAVADYLRLQYPKVLFTHIANERQTSPQRGAKLKRMGVKAGMPDLLIFERGTYSGLAIELKIKPNRPTENQERCLDFLAMCGWQCHVCYDFDEAKKIIDNYLT